MSPSLVFRIFGASPTRNRFAIGAIFYGHLEVHVTTSLSGEHGLFRQSNVSKFFPMHMLPGGMRAEVAAKSVCQSFPCLFCRKIPLAHVVSKNRGVAAVNRRHTIFQAFHSARCQRVHKDAKRLPSWPKRVLSAFFGLETEMLLRGFWGK